MRDHHGNKDQLTNTGQWRSIDSQRADHVTAIESARARQREAWRSSQRSSTGKILVVDDHELFRRSMALLLREYDVRVCATADEALRELQAHEYDVLICDLDLPGMNGEELTREVRRDSLRPQIPIVLISGFESETVLASVAQRINAAAYFRKHFSTEAFQAKIAELIDVAAPNELIDAAPNGEEP